MESPNPDDGALQRGESGSRPERAEPPGGKIRWGRERGPGAPGDGFLARLGPVSQDLAEFHNQISLVDGHDGAGEEFHHPRLPLETELETLTFTALDCETTGHFPDRMVELGAVRYQLPGPGGGPAPRLLLETLVHTTDHINPYARRVHGITRSMLTGAPSQRRVAMTFRDFSRGAILVEHSADSFDTRLVSKAMDRPLPHHHLDTSRMAGLLFQLRDTIGLERLCERLGVSHRQPHYALADAEATADCFCRLVEIGRQELGWRTLGDLVAVGMPPSPRPQIRPGHKSGGAPVAVGGAATRRRRHRAGRRHRSQAAVTPAPAAENGAT